MQTNIAHAGIEIKSTGRNELSGLRKRKWNVSRHLPGLEDTWGFSVKENGKLNKEEDIPQRQMLKIKFV